MSLTDWIWLSVAAYGIHILEEYQLDWRNWARAVIKLPVEWPDFYVVNALVIVLGIVAAELAATQPGAGPYLPGGDADQRHLLPHPAFRHHRRAVLARTGDGGAAVLADRRRQQRPRRGAAE